MMSVRHVSILVVLAVAVAAVLAAVIAGPASATPSKTTACTSCHNGTASGTVTATPSTSTPASGAAYTVAINIGLTAGGNTGYRVAQTDVGGTTTDWMAVYAGPGSQTSWTASMTAPATPGTYYYKVWCAKGKNNSTGMAKAATYSITVPAPTATAALTSLTPTSGPVGATLTISGTNMGTSGVVSVGGITATQTAWGATSITCTVPAGPTIGAKNVVVTPTGGTASNALPFTITVAPGPGDATAPTTTASGANAGGWCNDTIALTLTATDNAGGSGVASITYSVDGGAPVIVAGSTATVTISAHHDDEVAARAAQGAHTITYCATDVVGNAEAEHALTVNMDTVKPATEGAARRPRAAASGGGAQLRGPRRHAQRRDGHGGHHDQGQARQGREAAAPGHPAGEHRADGQIQLFAARRDLPVLGEGD